MFRLSDYPTVGEVEDFLVLVIDEADERPSKINPSLTKAQVWESFMKCVDSKDKNSPYIENREMARLAIKNINREFGEFGGYINVKQQFSID